MHSSNIDFFVLKDPSITYVVQEQGTIRKKAKLIDSTGYTYNMKYKTQTQTYWQCTVRPTGNRCNTFIVEKSGEFIAGLKQHNHCVQIRAINHNKLKLKKRTVKTKTGETSNVDSQEDIQ